MSNKKCKIREGEEEIFCKIQKYRLTKVSEDSYRFVPLDDPVTINPLFCRANGGPEKCLMAMEKYKTNFEKFPSVKD